MVVANATIRTEDVVEILDFKILASRAHPNLAILARDNYDFILSRIAERSLTPDQKDAFDNTLSSPSATNPVVLKEDLQSYVPQADLGEIKDSVANFSLLPLVGNTTGDLRGVIADGIIYRWNGTTWMEFIHTGTLDHTQLSNQNGDSNYLHLTSAEKTSILADAHSHANLAVLDDILAAGSGQIITAAERNQLPTADQKAALAGTSGLPSNTNRYVTNQDPRLDTVRNAYVTVGPPGSLASFSGVDAVPFEDALIAVDTGSATAVKAIEVLPGSYNIGGAVLTWDNNNAALLLEAFAPKSVVMSFQTFDEGLQALLPGTGALTVRGIIFELNNNFTSGILSQRPNTIIEDCVFRAGPIAGHFQTGVTLEGDDSVIRRCSFEGLQTGVEVVGAGCRVEDSVFEMKNARNVAVHVTGPDASVTNCVFNSGVIQTESSFAQITGNFWNQESSALICTINVANPAVVSCVNTFVNGDIVTFTTTGTLPTGLSVGRRYYVRNRTATQFNVSLLPAGPLAQTISSGTGVHTVKLEVFVLDTGDSTRVLENLPKDFNQPYIGATRTIGPPDSYADYRGTDQSPFLAAFDDPNVREVEILPGLYTFTETVDLPVGCKIKGTTQASSAVSIAGVSGIKLFTLSSNSGLENLFLSGSNSTLVSSVSSTNVLVERCVFTLTAGTSSHYALSTSSAIDFKIQKSSFNGTQGVAYALGSRNRISNSVFNCTSSNLVTSTETNAQIKHNHFVSSPAPALAGTALIIEGNHFLGALPTKINTSDSVWQSNYPSPEANNVEGIDNIVIDFGGSLRPMAGLVGFSQIGSAGTLAFDQTATASVTTLPLVLPARIDLSKPYSVSLRWTAPVFSGDVMWQYSVVFKDANGVLGTSSSKQQLSSRTGLAVTDVEVVSFPAEPSYGVLAAPVEVAFVVSRLGAHPSDNLAANAHLIGISITLPRD